MPRISVAVVAVLLVLGVGAGAWLALKPTEASELAACRAGGGSVAGADIGGPFELTAEDGRRTTAEEVIDRPTLVYFGYTFCPDVCPIDAAVMGQASDLLAEKGIGVNTAFVSVDPARDTPETLADFTDAMHPDMLGLTGSEEDVAAAADAYKVYYRKAETGDPDYYLMDHTAYTYLMHPERGMLDFFRHGSAPDEVAERVACYADALG